MRNLEAVEALGVGAGDYRQDGDLAAYTPEALTRRQRLRHDADVLRLMGAFFDALSETFEKVEKHAGKFTVFLNKGKHEAEIYLGQIEVDSTDFWTNRVLSSSSRSRA